jgi:uncharacterized membrane protein
MNKWGRWPTVLVVSTLLALLVTFINLQSPVRVVITFWFLLICPGMAFVRLLRIEDRLIELTLAVALSLSLDIIVVEGMLFFNRWSAELGLGVIAFACLIGTSLQIWVVSRRARFQAVPESAKTIVSSLEHPTNETSVN